jgi:uncharacterized protein
MSLSMIKNNLLKFILIILLAGLFSGTASAQDFPEKPSPPRLVNDFTGLLGNEEVNALERKLVAFNDSTSTQIAIVIVNDLHGYDRSDYAQRLAEKWGIGQRGLNNGILILVKTKTAGSQGQVAIAQGYGLEGAIPDITCGEIVDNDILPAFREGNYYTGLDKATSTLIALARGEFTAEAYGQFIKKKPKDPVAGIIMFIVIIVIIIAIISGRSGGSNNRNIGSKNLPLWLLLGMMNSGRNSPNGSWGGFSGGGGFGGGGGGGFGGFGGGSFGGGGAGGSW